ncbi:MAG TPA: hypothetical protein VF316_05370 [Polyangiaceae bacterium]
MTQRAVPARTTDAGTSRSALEVKLKRVRAIVHSSWHHRIAKGAAPAVPRWRSVVAQIVDVEPAYWDYEQVGWKRGLTSFGVLYPVLVGFNPANGKISPLAGYYDEWPDGVSMDLHNGPSFEISSDLADALTTALDRQRPPIWVNRNVRNDSTK